VTNQSHIDHAKLARQARLHAPELLAEWTSARGVRKKQTRRHLAKQGVEVPPDAAIIMIGPKTVRQLNIFAHKVALALYFEHFRTHLTNAGRVAAYWRTKEDYAAGVPQALLDLMPQYKTLVQGQWSTAEVFEYRFDVGKNGLLAFIARIRSGLFVSGFAVESFASVPDDMGADWIVPRDLLAPNPQFARKR
jgi:hypothetical protein